VALVSRSSGASVGKCEHDQPPSGLGLELFDCSQAAASRRNSSRYWGVVGQLTGHSRLPLVGISKVVTPSTPAVMALASHVSWYL
jgi:hypothetical protein